MTNTLELLLNEAQAQRKVAEQFTESLVIFARGYENFSKAVLLAVEAESKKAALSDEELETKLKTLSKIEPPKETPLESESDRQAVKETPLQEEPVVVEETPKKIRTKKEVTGKLPSTAELSRAVSAVFTNLSKEAYAWATKKMDELYDQYDIVKVDEIQGKAESADFLQSLKEIAEQAAAMTAEETEQSPEVEETPKPAPKKKAMTLEQFKEEVKAFADSKEESKTNALLAAKEKFGVAKASQVEPDDYAAFVEFMKEAETEDDGEF